MIHFLVPALTNVGPDCDPCGGPLKVIVQNEKRPNVLVRIKNENGPFLSLIYF
jgi:hypothetical protein